MGIFDWFKRKETPAQIARRRINEMPRERHAETPAASNAVAPAAVSASAEELPSLDASILSQPTTWGTALTPAEEPLRNPANVKQKILDHLAEQPQKRQWKKADFQATPEQQQTPTPAVQEQELEQIRFDQVGADLDISSRKKNG